MAIRRKDQIAINEYRAKLHRAANNDLVYLDETPEEKDQRKKRLLKDPKAFVEYYFPHYATVESAPFHIAFAQSVLKDPTGKHFAQWGRALAKSVWCDVILPFYLWANKECNYVVVIGNSKDKASRLLEDLQAELEANKRIIDDYGEQKWDGQWEAGNFRTRGGLVGKALGMGQSVRGLRVQAQRPDLVVLDDIETKDLAKNPRRQDEMVRWVERDLIPTMDGPRRRMLYANNRFAPRMIQTELQTRHPKWKVHEVKAYDPVTYKPTWTAKYDDDYFRIVEQEIGVLAAKAEYNNEPHVEGKIFTNDQIQWGKRPKLNHFQILVGHWDIAYAGTSTADFNAVKVWGLHGLNFWNINNYVKRSKMRAALYWMCDVQKHLPKSVSIHWRYESQFWNAEVDRTIREVERETGINLGLIKVDTPRTKKYDRILRQQVFYQNGRIYYDELLKSHNDTQEGISQLLSIEPNYNTNDDAPDADEQAIDFLSRHVNTGASSKPLMANYPTNRRF